jgi:methanogenic corrinoid protein MtbC1
MPQYEEITRQREFIVDQILTRIDPHHGSRGEYYVEKSRTDIRHTLDFTMESLAIRQKSVLVQYYRWLIETLSHYSIGQEPLLEMFRQVKSVLSPFLDDKENAFLGAISETEIISRSSATSPESGLRPEAEIYLGFLLKKDRHGAVRFLLDLVSQGVAMEIIYVEVIQAAMVEIGRLWQNRTIDVADEHMATVITQSAMTQLYPLLFDTPKNGKRLVALALGEELHEIGIRMVADLFEWSGFETEYLGANMPSFSVLDHLRRHRPHLVALSVTVATHLSRLVDLIHAIRNEPDLQTLKILIGGQAVAGIPDAQNIFGADGFAFHAADAVREGERLVGITRS